MIFGEKRDVEQKDGVKEAFAKVKNDIFTLGNEISDLKGDIISLKSQLTILNETLNLIKIDLMDLKNKPRDPKIPSYSPTDIPTQVLNKPSITAIPSNTPTVPVEIGGLKYPNFNSSSGNEGVPTDRQTNQQTDNYGRFSVDEAPASPFIRPLKEQIHDASKILDSLDSLKKEIRLKFKQMTSQEMLVFSTIYQLEEQFPEGLEYRQIATRLKLSESSIRDYTQKLIAKGIPVDKIKLNNKKILLKISSKLKSIAPLETIMRLREL